MNKLFSEGRADALALAGLILMATGWGSTFFVIKDILDRLDAADLLGVRFTVTALSTTIMSSSSNRTPMPSTGVGAGRAGRGPGSSTSSTAPSGRRSDLLRATPSSRTSPRPHSSPTQERNRPRRIVSSRLVASRVRHPGVPFLLFVSEFYL